MWLDPGQARDAYEKHIFDNDNLKSEREREVRVRERKERERERKKSEKEHAKLVIGYQRHDTSSHQDAFGVV